MKSNAPYRLNRLRQAYRFNQLGEILLVSVSVGMISLVGQVWVGVPLWLALVFSVIGSILIFLHESVKHHVFSTTPNRIASYLNQRYPILQNSCDLLLKDDSELTTLQQLQKNKVELAFQGLYPTIRLPHHRLRAISIFVLSILFVFGFTAFVPKYSTEIENIKEKTTEAFHQQTLPADIKAITVDIQPPHYTNLPSHQVRALPLKVIEGSVVTWSITFTQEVQEAKLIFSSGDSVKLSRHATFTLQRSLSQNGFYQLTWFNGESWRSSDFQKIEIIKDLPPVVALKNQNQFTELTPTDKMAVTIHADLSDDFGLSETSIIATVSKGSGESVKFREEKLFFEGDGKISGRKLETSRLIDLVKLGMEPGDELYFYVEAYDNRSPVPNRSRTETYFITLQDTTQLESSFDDGLGVDLMPEYFRSQRQIIIDTEKLLKEKKRISSFDFKSKSNELAYDQKVLRLRYGEFLGEEFESGIGPQGNPAEQEEDEDVTKKYGHVHDKDNEHNLVEEKKVTKAEPEHHHDGNEKDEDKNGIPSEFIHQHDSEDEATFFTQSIRSKLKAALTIMWDAELHLRLYEPEKSLPYQYKALKLLKEISQDSRIYVHRSGFDPPPIKEEKRLSGDLSEVGNTTASSTRLNAGDYISIRKVFRSIGHLLTQDSIVISNGFKNELKSAGQELAKLAVNEPGRYLISLSTIRNLLSENYSEEEERSALLALQRTFNSILKESAPSPSAQQRILHPLEEMFIKNLKDAYE